MKKCQNHTTSALNGVPGRARTADVLLRSTFQRMVRSDVSYQQMLEKTRKREKNEGNRYLIVFLSIAPYHPVLHGQISKLLARFLAETLKVVC